MIVTTDGSSVDPDGYFLEIGGATPGMIPFSRSLAADSMDVLLMTADRMVAFSCSSATGPNRTGFTASGPTVLDGAGLANLTPFSYSAIGAAWSPDGQRIAFWTDREIPLGRAIGVQLYILDLRPSSMSSEPASPQARLKGPANLGDP